MKGIWGIGISSILVLGMGGCGLILDVDAEEYGPACQAGQLECEGNAPRTCVNGLWKELSACVGQTCIDGQCRGKCEAGKKICDGNTPVACDSTGNPIAGAVCSGVTSLCFEGACIKTPPSCVGLPTTCGPDGDESCCAVTSVPGGTYNRSNDPMFPATVSDFVLDRFEITVGRFRKFVEAYPGNKPKSGDGKHPLIGGSGWDAVWDSNLPADKAGLIVNVKCDPVYQMWTDAPGANENKPMNCITWYEVFSFCAWDGGRLPTEAEWNYAAAGGDEQREYPWSNPPASAEIDVSFAVYGVAPIGGVGSRSPKGDAEWGQADLGGSMWEWNLDPYANTYPSECNNCVDMASSSGRVIRGGSWTSIAPSMLCSSRSGALSSNRYSYIGGRCARTPQ